MRFASMTSNGGNYAAAGKAVADSAAKTFAVQRKTGPDYGKLSQVAMKTATEEKISSMQASAKVTNSGIDAYSNVTNTGQKVAVFNNEQDIKNKQRKAGGIAAIGKMAAVGVLSKDNNKGREYPTNSDARKGLFSEHEATLAEINKRRETYNSNSANSIDSATSTPPASSGSTPGKVEGGTSGAPTADPSTIRSQAFNYLTNDKGLSKNKALGIIANVDRESNWKPNIRSGDDNGPGGLFQWKGSRQTPTVAGLVNSGDWKGQLDYALSEPGEAFSQTYQNTTYASPQQAADAWMTHWERPADTTAGSQKHTQFLGGYNF